jgi:hypothetical protein
MFCAPVFSRPKMSELRAFELDFENWVCGHFAGHAVMSARHIGETKILNGSASHE